MDTAPTPHAAWGEPGSFLLPRALREHTDATPVPATVRRSVPSLPREEMLGTARFPSDWVLLPALARRLVEFLRETGLLDRPVMPRSFDITVLAGLNTSAVHRIGAQVDRSPVLSRARTGTGAPDVATFLHEVSFRALRVAAGNEAERFMTVCGEMDVILADIEAALAAERNVSDADDGIPSTGEDRITVDAAHRGEPARLVRHAPGGAELFLGEQHRTMLSRLTDEGWTALLDQLPTSLAGALLRHAGGADEVRQLLLRATRSEVFSIRHLEDGPGSALRLALNAALESGRLPASDTSEEPAEPRSEPVTAESEVPSRPTLPVDADLVRADDPRFERFVRPGPTLADVLERVAPAEAHDLVTQVVSQLQSIEVETLEDEGTILIAAASQLPVDHPRVTAMALRYGLSGRDPAPMVDVAGILGVSRARVGQLSQQLTARLPRGAVWAPVCDQMLLLIEAVVPCSVAELSTVMRDAGLTSTDWSVAALLRVAELFGRELDLLDVDGVAVAADSAPAIRQIVKSARRLSERNGAATIGSVMLDTASEPDVGEEITEGLVRDVLSSRDDVNWLSDPWFWTHHGAGRNRLVNTSRHILAARRPQRLSSMAEGIRRSSAWRNSTGGRSGSGAELVPPPDAVLEAFYRRHPAFVTDGAGLIDTAEPVDIEILGPEKATLVSILRAQEWPVMSRTDLIGTCVAEGMKTATAGVFLTYAEVVESFGMNAWGLRGADIPAHVIEEVQKKARRESRSFEADWHDSVTPGGHPWFARRISPGVLYSGVIATSWATNLPDEGRFALIDGTDGESEGVLRRSGAFLHGLTKFFRKNRPAVGDHLRIVLYKAGGYIVAEVGGEELASEPEDWE